MSGFATQSLLLGVSPKEAVNSRNLATFTEDAEDPLRELAEEQNE
jgi:hypothetical protein